MSGSRSAGCQGCHSRDMACPGPPCSPSYKVSVCRVQCSQTLPRPSVTSMHASTEPSVLALNSCAWAHLCSLYQHLPADLVLLAPFCLELPQLLLLQRGPYFCHSYATLPHCRDAT